MPNIQPFEDYSDEYDLWFEQNREKYGLELQAIAGFIPAGLHGIEVGVGSGKFAVPLGVEIGVDPSVRMLDKASERGIQTVQAIAENLPFPPACFDYVLMVTTICFVDDLHRSFEEARRVLKKDGFILVGFVDGASELGQEYMARKDRSRFYRSAHFYATDELVQYLKDAGFGAMAFRQTLLPGAEASLIKEGYGEGSFVVVRAMR
jgi:ubiquinone/menaquinone biosynthesis C-methylase UbiE